MLRLLQLMNISLVFFITRNSVLFSTWADRFVCFYFASLIFSIFISPTAFWLGRTQESIYCSNREQDWRSDWTVSAIDSFWPIDATCEHRYAICVGAVERIWGAGASCSCRHSMNSSNAIYHQHTNVDNFEIPSFRFIFVVRNLVLSQVTAMCPMASQPHNRSSVLAPTNDIIDKYRI